MATSDLLYQAIEDIQESLQAEADNDGQPEPHLLETLAHMRYSQLRRDLTPDTTLAECLAHLDASEIDTEQDPHLPGAIELLRRDVIAEINNEIAETDQTIAKINSVVVLSK